MTPQRGVLFGLTIALTWAAAGLGVSSAGAAVSQVGGCVIAPFAQCAGADLRNADLTNARLTGANLEGARLDGANFRGANLHGANFAHASGERVNLSRALLQNARLYLARLPRVNLDGSQLDGASLNFATLTHARAHATNFAGASLFRAVLHTSDFTGANFYGTKLNGTDFTFSNLTDANFAHATFLSTGMSHTKTSGTTLWPSNFDADELALRGVFQRVDFQINAYGSQGTCYGHERTDKVLWTSGFGRCLGSTERSVNPWVHGYSGWEWYGSSSYRELSIRGSSVLEPGPVTYLSGRADGNWHAFKVTKISNLAAEPTGARAIGEPGGPLALNLRHKEYWRQGYGLWDGYILEVRGWLRRAR